MLTRVFLVLTYACALWANSLHAAFTIKNGSLVDVSEVATMSAEGHFSAAAKAFDAEDWDEAARQFYIVTVNFPNTPYAKEGYYYLGISYYNLEELDYANDAFSDYLKVQSNPRFFQEAIEYKFAIAENFLQGAKRRFLGTKKLPKWASGNNLAITIYDEVIAAVPSQEMAARALVSKGYLLWRMRDYRGAVDAFNTVIRRFPKHELAPECYLLISKAYLEQSQYEYQNPDILAFAQINMRRFEREFPREERLNIVQENVMAIKEVYAQGLYEIGQFYERTCKPRAAVIYYYNTIQQFPDTCVAAFCRDRIKCLDPSYCEVEVQDEGQIESPSLSECA